jgi:hypothetical protein
MRIFYIDESGTGLRQRDTPYFVLASLGLPADRWSDLDRAVVELKRYLIPWAKPEDFELKGRALRRGEGMFRSLDWRQRATAFRAIAEMLAGLPVGIYAVRIHKPSLPLTITTEADLYRLAFWKLLDVVHRELREETGLIILDSRSDLHSSIQDRRVIDAYRDWCTSRCPTPAFFELPLFGFSEFYSGLQMADFCAYLIDFNSNEDAAHGHRFGAAELQQAFRLLAGKLRIAEIP